MKTSVFIPTKNPGHALKALIRSLRKQTVLPGEIIIVDSGSTDGSIEKVSKTYKSNEPCPVFIHKIKSKEFGHGRTRNKALSLAKYELIVFLTQDVVIEENTFIESITAPLMQDTRGALAATFARQIAKHEHHPLEKFFSSFYFPPTTIVHARIPKKDLVMADIFFSNAASCIRKNVLALFPFDEKLIMCEDQKFALDALTHGYIIRYTPEARVFHSHNYSTKNTFKRYFDSAYAFEHIVSKPSSNMVLVGARYMYRELLFIFRHNPLWISRYFKINAAKIAGTLLAILSVNFPKLFSTKQLKKLSLHPYFWDKQVETKQLAKTSFAPNHKRFLSACAVVKNEGLYIKNWLDFHIKLGFEHFYIYNNGSTDQTTEILQPYIQKGLVTLTNWPERPGQITAYLHCCNTYKNESTWIGFFDIDEYLEQLSNVSLKDFLNKYPNIPGLGIHWAIFGSGGKMTYEAKPDYDRLVHRGVKHIERNKHIKCIVNPRKVLDVLGPHFSNTRIMSL